MTSRRVAILCVPVIGLLLSVSKVQAAGSAPVLAALQTQFVSIPSNAVEPTLGVTLTSWRHELLTTGIGIDAENDAVTLEAGWSLVASNIATDGDWHAFTVQVRSPNPTVFTTSGVPFTVNLSPLPSIESPLYTRLRASDGISWSPWATAPAAFVDTVAPRGLAAAQVTTTGGDFLELQWDAASDPEFAAYAIGVLSTGNLLPHSTGWSLFSPPRDSALASSATTRFTCRPLPYDSSHRVLLIAEDAFHNQIRSSILQAETMNLFAALETNTPMLYPRTNPYRYRLPANLQLSYQLLEPATVSISIWSTLHTSTAIRVLPPGNLGTGLHQVLWDGKSDSGFYADEGAYSVRLSGTTTSGHTVVSPDLGVEIKY